LEVSGKAYLGPLSFQPDGLYVIRIDAYVDSFALSDFLYKEINQYAIDIVSAQMCISVGREHLKDTVLQFQDRYIECAAPEVINGDGALRVLLKSVGQRGGGR